MKISILIPTRGRPNLVVESINSLLATANDPSNVEILLGVDDDDKATLKWTASRPDFKVTRFKRLGYKNLYKYYNKLANRATGDVFIIWNDDATMETINWDTVVEEYQNHLIILRMQVVNHPHPFALFPIVPRKWIELLGYLSPTAQIDRFIYEVCHTLKPVPMVNIPVECLHHRFDVSGKNKDTTFEEREYMEGDPSNPLHIDSPQNRAIIRQDAIKLLTFIQSNGGIKYA